MALPTAHMRIPRAPGITRAIACLIPVCVQGPAIYPISASLLPRHCLGSAGDWFPRTNRLILALVC